MSNPRAELIDGLLRDGWEIEDGSWRSPCRMVLRRSDALVWVSAEMLHSMTEAEGFVVVGDLSNQTLAKFTPFAEDAHIRAFIDANYPPPVAHPVRREHP